MDAVLGKVDDTVGDFVNNNCDVLNENVGNFFTNVTLLCALLGSIKDKPFPKTSESFDSKYDYIIVGGGSAGSVMANRLSEIPCIKVLLLEAGGDAPLLSEIPSYARIFYGSEIDWLYMTEPQKYCAFGQKENKIPLNNGKGLGGSSLINAMLDVRGCKGNYDNWVKEGCTGWSYEDVLPYFLKMEDNKNTGGLDKGYHHEGGPMTMMRPRYTSEVKIPLLNATAAMGLEVRDINGEKMTGVYDLQATMRNCQRCSAAKAYLVPAEDRPNLTILKRAFVEKILIKNKKAIGVQFNYKGSTETVRACREVIVSSGTIRAPQLLMLSGIGPKEQLEKFEIPVVSELPVGKNFHDHFAGSRYYQIDPLIMNAVVKSLNPINVLEYVTNRTGPLCSPTQVNLMAFTDGKKPTSESKDCPKQEIYFIEYVADDALKNNNLNLETFTLGYAPYSLSPVIWCISSLTQPASRGEITLKSTDPHDYPKIDPHYHEEESDTMTIVEGMDICDEVFSSEAMKEVNPKPFEAHYPWCEKDQGNHTAYYACLAKTVVSTFWHFVGTCRMGNSSDPRSVVDVQGRVIGVENLRVVCAAIMPIIPCGNTNVPTMMVAEKIAAEMKKEINCDKKTKCKCCKCKDKQKKKSETRCKCKRTSEKQEKPDSKSNRNDNRDCDYH